MREQHLSQGVSQCAYGGRLAAGGDLLRLDNFSGGGSGSTAKAPQ